MGPGRDKAGGPPASAGTRRSRKDTPFPESDPVDPVR